MLCDVLLQALVLPLGVLTVSREVGVLLGQGSITSDGLGQLLYTGKQYINKMRIQTQVCLCYHSLVAATESQHSLTSRQVPKLPQKASPDAVLSIC